MGLAAAERDGFAAMQRAFDEKPGTAEVVAGHEICLGICRGICLVASSTPLGAGLEWARKRDGAAKGRPTGIGVLAAFNR